jgi:hypothetical protein
MNWRWGYFALYYFNITALAIAQSAREIPIQVQGFGLPPFLQHFLGSILVNPFCRKNRLMGWM